MQPTNRSPQLERDLELVGPARATYEMLSAWRGRAVELGEGGSAINDYLRWAAIRQACEDLGAEMQEDVSLRTKIRRDWWRPWPRAIP